jgi:hypothetical protein
MLKKHKSFDIDQIQSAGSKVLRSGIYKHIKSI